MAGAGGTLPATHTTPNIKPAIFPAIIEGMFR